MHLNFIRRGDTTCLKLAIQTQWKTTLNGRQPLMEDGLWRMTAFEGWQPLLGDDLGLKMGFDGGGPFTTDYFWQ